MKRLSVDGGKISSSSTRRVQLQKILYKPQALMSRIDKGYGTETNDSDAVLLLQCYYSRNQGTSQNQSSKVSV